VRLDRPLVRAARDAVHGHATRQPVPGPGDPPPPPVSHVHILPAQGAQATGRTLTGPLLRATAAIARRAMTKYDGLLASFDNVEDYLRSLPGPEGTVPG